MNCTLPIESRWFKSLYAILALRPNTCLQLTQLVATKELESNRFIRILGAQSLGSCLYEIQPKLT